MNSEQVATSSKRQQCIDKANELVAIINKWRKKLPMLFAEADAKIDGDGYPTGGDFINQSAEFDSLEAAKAAVEREW